MKEEAIMKDHVNTAMEIRDSINLLRDRLDALEKKSAGLGQRHLDFVMAENNGKAWEHKSVLHIKPVASKASLFCIGASRGAKESRHDVG